MPYIASKYDGPQPHPTKLDDGTYHGTVQDFRVALRYVAPDKLSITPDCGFSQTARWAARAKLKSMVDGARIVRRELAG